MMSQKIKTQIKKLKPVEIDCSLKYVCNECNNAHWIFLREAKVKNFKIVCECDNIIYPKTISEISLVYKHTEAITNKPTVVIPPVPASKVSLDIQRECDTILKGMGYSSEEIADIIPEAIDSARVSYIKAIIDYSLKNIGDKNV